jgi:DNA-binding MarR family transcriptional regulator
MPFQVLNEIGIINQLATNKFEQVMPHGLTISQFQVLNHFVRLGGDEGIEKNLGALARAFQVSKATISGVVANLERKGFVMLRQDPNDGRGRLASITDAGRKAREDSIAAIEPHLARMRVALPEGTFEGLLPGLVTLRRYLDENR